MLNKNNISFVKGDCLSEQMLNDYHVGNLSKEEIRKVELHLADCEMCSDYVEGLSYLENLNELENESQLIINKINKNIIKKNKPDNHRIWLFAAAASVLIAISLTSLILFFPSKNKFVADNLKSISQKIDTPYETKPQKELGFKKDKSGTSNDIINGNEQNKVVEKIAIVADNEIDKSENQLIENKKNDNKTTISGEFYSEPKGEGVKSIAFGSNTSIADETKGIVSEVVTKESPNINVKTTSTLEEEKNEIQLKNDEKNVILLAKAESSKDKNSTQKKQERSSKNAPASVEQSVVNTGATGGDEIKSFDLDNATTNLEKQKTDSVIILALRGVNSPIDSIKWKSKLLLAKAYVVSGENEKAIALFYEIKKNSQGYFKKEAQKELKKLGF